MPALPPTSTNHSHSHTLAPRLSNVPGSHSTAGGGCLTDALHDQRRGPLALLCCGHLLCVCVLGWVGVKKGVMSQAFKQKALCAPLVWLHKQQPASLLGATGTKTLATDTHKSPDNCYPQRTPSSQALTNNALLVKQSQHECRFVWLLNHRQQLRHVPYIDTWELMTGGCMEIQWMKMQLARLAAKGAMCVVCCGMKRRAELLSC